MHQVYGDGCVDALHVFLSDKNIRDLPTQCQNSVLLHPPSLLDLLNYPGEMSSEATTCPARSSCNTTSTCYSVCESSKGRAGDNGRNLAALLARSRCCFKDACQIAPRTTPEQQRKAVLGAHAEPASTNNAGSS